MTWRLKSIYNRQRETRKWEAALRGIKLKDGSSTEEFTPEQEEKIKKALEKTIDGNYYNKNSR